MYADASALLKLYFREPESDEVEAILHAERPVASAVVTLVEVRRNLARRLRGSDLVRARSEFERDWHNLEIVDVDSSLCERAAEIGESLGVRSLDALHLSAAERVGGAFLTYDRRQAEAGRVLGWTVLGT